MKNKIPINSLLAVGVFLAAIEDLTAQSHDLDVIQHVKMLTGSNCLSHVKETLIPQMKAICSGTTNTAEKLKIVDYLAENAIARNGNSDEDRFFLLEYAANEHALLQSANETSVWAGDVMRRFVKSECGDVYKAFALKKLMEFQFLGGNQPAAKSTFDDLLRLTRSSQDPTCVAQRSGILIQALGEFSEASDDTKEGGADWLREKILQQLHDPRNSPEDNVGFTMGLGSVYSSPKTSELRS